MIIFGLKQTLWDRIDSKCDSFQYLSKFCKGLLCEVGATRTSRFTLLLVWTRIQVALCSLPNMAMPMLASWISNCSLKRFRNAIMPWSRDLGSLILSERLLLPIARDEDSIITRKVAKGVGICSYKLPGCSIFGDIHLVVIQLHTGRTHQIRVHFSHIGFSALGR